MRFVTGPAELKEFISETATGMSGLVRFCALLRIKPHAPPLVRAPSIPLSFSLATVLPRRMLNALVAPPSSKLPDS